MNVVKECLVSGNEWFVCFEYGFVFIDPFSEYINRVGGNKMRGVLVLGADSLCIVGEGVDSVVVDRPLGDCEAELNPSPLFTHYSKEDLKICKVSLKIDSEEYDGLGGDDFFSGTVKDTVDKNVYSKEFVVKDKFLQFVFAQMNTTDITNHHYQTAMHDCAEMSSKIIDLERKIWSMESSNIFQRIFKRW